MLRLAAKRNVLPSLQLDTYQYNSPMQFPLGYVPSLTSSDASQFLDSLATTQNIVPVM
jgi:hypothetical protein